MKATETNLLTFLRSPKQLVIPIYQRRYSWTRKECRQLWDDVLRAAKDRDIEAHFVGSIVYIAKGFYQATGIPQLLIIDGQQRLTTLSLLLAALAHEIKKRDNEKIETNPKRITNYYLLNQDEDEEFRYKLVLTRGDKSTLFNVVDNVDLSAQASHRIYDNFNLFRELISKTDLDLDLLYEGLGKLLVVDVSLDRRYDNPQLIFESLNSTGLDLSQADLIRNFILIGLEPTLQEELYRRYCSHWLA